MSESLLMTCTRNPKWAAERIEELERAALPELQASGECHDAAEHNEGCFRAVKAERELVDATSKIRLLREDIKCFEREFDKRETPLSTTGLTEEKAAELYAYRAALEAIIDDPEADAVALAHTAITPFTPWVPAGEEVTTQLDAAALSATGLIPQWIVNDIGELGVKVGDRFFFLYKGDNIIYGEDADDSKDGIATHDSGEPMMYRIVGKREFGETCQPLENFRKKWPGGQGAPYREPVVFTPGLSDGKPDDGDWKPLPALSAKGERG